MGSFYIYFFFHKYVLLRIKTKSQNMYMITEDYHKLQKKKKIYIYIYIYNIKNKKSPGGELSGYNNYMIFNPWGWCEEIGNIVTLSCNSISFLPEKRRRGNPILLLVRFIHAKWSVFYPNKNLIRNYRIKFQLFSNTCQIPLKISQPLFWICMI